MEKGDNRGRVKILDALRGLCVVLMVIHHFNYDLVWLCGAPEWIFTNPVLDFFHYVFAGLFILISGISSHFSRSNLRRGVKCFAVAMAMTVVTSLPFIDEPILFGVLHLLGVCMILYGLIGPVLDRIPKALAPVLWISLIVLSSLLVNNTDIGRAARVLFPLGWTYPGFYSADYFPILPWVFVFLLGTWAGFYVKAGRLPRWFYRFTCPPFEYVGRRALIVYILHQPVMYGAILLVKFLLNK